MRTAIRLTFVALALSAQACNGPPERLPVVAQVGSVTLDEAELLDQLPIQLEGSEAVEARRKFVDKWVEQELLYQEAVTRGMDQNARLSMLLEQSRRDILVAALLDNEFDDKPPAVSEKDIRGYYDAHQNQFIREREEIRAEHIVMRSRRDANALRRELVQGLDFAVVAGEHSVDESTSRRGGDMGYFTVDDYPELWETCQALTIGKISKPVATEGGFLHIIRVLERAERGSVKALEQVRPRIVETLVRDDYRRRLNDFITWLREQKTVTIDDKRLAQL